MPVSPKQNQRRSSVLVVDDHEDGLAISTELLELHGFDVTGARNGPEALALLGRAAPDVVVLDLMMPKMSGAEVLKEVNAGATRVVVYTGVGDAKRLAPISSHAAVSAVLLKPATPDELVAAVRDAARR